VIYQFAALTDDSLGKHPSRKEPRDIPNAVGQRLSSIFTVHEYHKKLSTEEQLGRNLVICPSMDPNEAFYVINPMRATNSVFKELEDLMKYLKVFDKNNNYKLLFL
jgi:hypothetical protein